MRRLRDTLALVAVVSMLAFSGAAGPGHAVEPDEILANPALESRARTLSSELRCLVCQNQSIDDSNAPLARDLRLLVRERLQAGDSNAQILDYVVARYGEFVLLRPRFSAATLLLWLAPLLILVVGVFLARSVLRAQQPAADNAAKLSAEDEQRLATILKEPSDTA